MKLPLILVALLVIATTPSQAQPSQDEARIRTELQAFVSELSAAIGNQDRSALERLYAPEFVFMHGFGNHDDRDEQITSVMDAVAPAGLPAGAAFGAEDALIVEGNVAIRRRTSISMGQRLFNTTVYLKRSGAWQLLQIQSTVMTPERVAIEVPVDTLRSYVGRYAQSNGNVAEFSLDAGQLLVRFPGQPSGG